MKMSGIVFSNIYDDTLGELSAKRTVASLPFGGRYRQIDFTLSNMANSNITSIGVITKYNYQSLMDHLGSCEEWDLNRKHGGLYIIPPFSTGRATEVYHGKLEALHTAMGFLKSQSSEYIVLSDTITICNIDYRKILDCHIKSGKDITVIATTPANFTDGNMLVLDIDGNNVNKIVVNYPAGEKSLVGMGMYIMDREVLIKEVEEAVASGLYYFEKDFLQKRFNEGTLSVNVCKFEGVVLRNKNISAYFKNNLALLDEKIREDIFRKDAPVYTKVRDEIPTFYGEESEINECIIADGCKLEGTVENSVLFRDVKVRKGAAVKNSIIMQGSVIEEGAFVENAILDKDVKVTAGTKLIGAEESPIIIKKGETV